MSIEQKIKPMGGRIVVQRDEEAKISKGGIILPESAQTKPREGVVVAVGPGKSRKNGQVEPIDLKVGDKVLISSYGGTEYTLGNIEYVILSAEDVLAICEREETDV